MIATRNEMTGLLELDTSPRRYHEFVGGFGWLVANEKAADMQKHWVTVIGHGEDDVYRIVYEASGDLGQVVNAAIGFKDNLLVRRFIHDGSNPQIPIIVHTNDSYDGLTRYRDRGRDIMDRVQYALPPEHWETFRDRSTVASLVPIPERWRGDLQAAIDLFSTLWRSGRARPAQSCHTIMRVTRQDPKEWLAHPLMRAVAWTIYYLEQTKPRGDFGGEKWVNPYPNV